MNVHAETLIPIEDQRLFRMVRQLLLGISVHPTTSCHTLSRAIGSVCCLSHVDGHFNHAYEHSWLLTPNKNIIDVYPVGLIGGPLLLDDPWFNLYLPDADWSTKIDPAEVEQLIQILRQGDYRAS